MFFSDPQCVWRSLSQAVVQSLVAALVLTKLDFGDAALAGLHSVVSTGPPTGGHECSGSTYLPHHAVTRYDHITPLRYSAACTWLRVRSATFKLAVMVYQCVRGAWTGLHGRRPSAGRQDSRSTTPAAIVDVSIGRPVYVRDCPLSAPRHEHGTVCQLK